MTREKATVLFLAILLLAGPARAGQSAPSLAITLTARTLQPGELVVFDVVAPSAISVQVDVFEKRISAFEKSDGVWRALVGIDLDQKPGRYAAIVEALAGLTVVRSSHPFLILEKRFPRRALRVEPGFVNPPPALLGRIAAEASFIREPYAGSSANRLWADPFIRPVGQPANSGFGVRSVFNGEPRSPHGGADFLSPSGTPVKAPNAGRVVCARDLFFTGNTVIIDHGLGVFSTLAHLSRMDVQEGATVEAGQIIGWVGATGRVTGPHLHWALTVSGARVYPLSLLALLGGTAGSSTAAPAP